MATASELPRVALLAHDVHDDGGMERCLAELVRRAHGRVRFTVISSTLAPELRELVDWVRLPIPRRPFPLKFVAYFLLGGARLAFVRRDLSHSTGAIVPQRTDVSTVHFCHAGFANAGVMGSEGLSLPRRLNRYLHRRLALAAERWCFRGHGVRAFVAVSAGIERELEQAYPPRPTFIAPNGVDVARFRPDAAAGPALRAELGVPDDRRVALFVGGDWDRKGLDVAIQAVAQTREGWELWVVGPGQQARYTEIARGVGAETRVRFLGSRRDTERFYQAADAFVFPTLYESFSLVAYEAAACELPLVATPANGIDELVDGGCAGLPVARAPGEIAAALDRLATDPALARELGRSGRRRVLDFTWAEHVERTLDAYRSLGVPVLPSEGDAADDSGRSAAVIMGTR